MRALTLTTFSCILISMGFVGVLSFVLPVEVFLQTSSQLECTEESPDCTEEIIISEDQPDTNAQLFAYIMIVLGVSILLINWRINSLIPNKVDKTNTKP